MTSAELELYVTSEQVPWLLGVIPKIAPKLSPLDKFALRLVLHGTGKTVMRDGRLCELIQTPTLRQFVPLVEADGTEAEPVALWEARPKMRRQSRRERRQWMYSRKYLSEPFAPPHWTGEPRPKGARSVEARSQFPTASYLTKLVKDCGYAGSAAFAALGHAHQPWLLIPDRHRLLRAGLDEETSQSLEPSPEHPYVPAAPSRRTLQGGGFRKEQVTAALACRRWEEKHLTAVFEVIYLRRAPALVAASLQLKVETVHRHCSQILADLRA